MPVSSRPNILWISFEDTFPYYGCYGDTVAKTPNVDKLADQGCIYPNAFSTTGVCAPSRAAVITGMYSTTIGTQHMRTTHLNEQVPELPTPYDAVIPPYVKCFSEYLRAEGYYCTNNAKTDYQFAPPFTAWDDCSKNGHWRNRPDKEQPFFAVFNPVLTHESASWEEHNNELLFDPEEMVLPPYYPDTPKVRRAMAKVYSQITRADSVMGELLGQLEEDGLADNTIVCHWSDHGPLPRGKRWLYDAGVHVPLIIRWPGRIKPGTRNKRLVSTVDLAPTMLSMADIGVPPYMQGRAFLGAGEEEEREYVYLTRDRFDSSYDLARGIRDKRYKYIRHYNPGKSYYPWVPYRNRHPVMQEWYRLHLEGGLNESQSVMFKKKPPEELYDTKTDPFELNNLARLKKYQGELKRLSGALTQWQARTRDLFDLPEEEMVRGWYPGGVQPKTVTPLVLPIHDESPGLVPLVEEGSYKDKVLVQFYCATQGASIGYKLDKDDEWKLYTVPFVLERGEHTVTCKAIRIGYKESDEANVKIIVA